MSILLPFNCAHCGVGSMASKQRLNRSAKQGRPPYCSYSCVAEARIAAPRAKCGHVDCSSAVSSRGLCELHYRRYLSGYPRQRDRKVPFAVRFADKFEYEQMSGCWLWNARVNPYGYGVISYNGRQMPASRASLMFHQGIHSLASDVCVLHRCDTPACVNPDHLFIGSQAENLADMRKKGRGYDINKGRIGA